MVMASIHFLRASFLLALSQPAAAASGCAGHACAKDRDAMEPEGLGPAEAEFEVFRKSFRRNYEHGSKEYWLRRGLYEKRTVMVNTHNARLDRLWQAVAGPFADFTEAERSSMRGYKSSPLSKSGGVELPAAAAREREFLRPQAKIPKEFNWMNLTMARIVPDQGQCGSCWAVASKSVLDAHHEIYVSKGGPLRNFSAQQIVSCVPNPRVCGGTGGCGGATVELAFDWVVHNGCADQSDVPYLAKDLSSDKAKCSDSKQLSVTKSLLGASHHQHEQAMPAMGGFLLGMHGYHMLERNKEQPLLMAVYQHGPVAVSVAAGDWFEYKNGLFDGCAKDTIVDHAVTLFGFGEATAKPHDDPNSFPVLLTPVQRRHGHDNESPHFESSVKKYWLIRNSWGVSWGESGFIRMLRAGGYGEANERCGTDTDNSQGTGCKGDNKTVQVCGMCGCLWDSVVPHFQPTTSLAEKSMLELDPAGKLVRREGSN